MGLFLWAGAVLYQQDRSGFFVVDPSVPALPGHLPLTKGGLGCGGVNFAGGVFNGL